MKIVFVSGILPSGHYSQYITSGLNKHNDVDIIVYTDKDAKNLSVKNCGKIKNIWSRSPIYIFQILKEAKKDKPDVIHLQHELNMYGNSVTAIIFPFLVFALRVFGFKVVVTIHAAVFRSQIDKEFVKLFQREQLKPIYLKMIFYYLYRLIVLFSNIIIVHTELTKKILVDDYGVSQRKVKVVPAAIPQKIFNSKKNDPKEKYFFYFGYMVRRKGLEYALQGFKKFIARNPKTNYKFILAGGVIKGQEQAYKEIKNMIKQSGLEGKVIIKGFIEEKDQDELYLGAYAVVIPAIISMGSSGPLYHAESYGKCVIASKIGHFLEDIENLKTGILVNNEEWADVFQSIISNPKLVKAIENNVKIKAESRSPFKTADKYLILYRSLS